MRARVHHVLREAAGRQEGRPTRARPSAWTGSGCSRAGGADADPPRRRSARAMCRLAGRHRRRRAVLPLTPDGCSRRWSTWRRAPARRAATRRSSGFGRLTPAPWTSPRTWCDSWAARLLTGYAMTPAYNASLARQGFESQASGIIEAWNDGERDRATEQFDDAMFDDLFVHGDAGAMRGAGSTPAARRGSRRRSRSCRSRVAGSIEASAQREAGRGGADRGAALPPPRVEDGHQRGEPGVRAVHEQGQHRAVHRQVPDQLARRRRRTGSR